MKRWLGVLGLVLVGLATLACQNEDPGSTAPTIVITNNNTNNNQGAGGPAPSPSAAPGSVAAVHLGCFGMVDPSGTPLSECGAGLATYFAPAGSKGTLDATPVDGDGNKLPGLSVTGWSANGACAVTGDASGPDGFNPAIEIGTGNCVVSVIVAGVTGGPRLFVGQ